MFDRVPQTELVESFLKEAAAMPGATTRKTYAQPATTGDMLKQTRQKAVQPQNYSQPVGKTDHTNPSLAAAHKAVPPPPV
ncbi:MAG: hypothetical protein DRQ64_00075 [Gammaproteobacteria bacterium]|nr:MAG: hypothetical protein DRQ64_00075 [Gammaproteobacteria bacterium]